MQHCHGPLSRISEQLIPSREHVVNGQPPREQGKRAHSPPHTHRAPDTTFLLAFPTTALRKLQLPEDVVPPSIKVLDDHVETLVGQLPDDREVRKAATIVRAYMFAVQMGVAPAPGGADASGATSVKDDEAAFRAMESERDRLTRVVFGIEPGDDPLAPNEAVSKLTKITAQYDTAKAKLIASLSQQIMDVTREVLAATSSCDVGKSAATSPPNEAPASAAAAPPAAPPAAPTPWLGSLFMSPLTSPVHEAANVDRPTTPAGGRTSIASPTSRASAHLERIHL